MKSKKSFIGVLPLVLFTIVALSLVAIISLVKSPVWIPVMAAVSLVSLIVMVICYEIVKPSTSYIIDVLKEVQITSLLCKNTAADIVEVVNNNAQCLKNIHAIVMEIANKDNGLPVGNPDDSEDTASFHGLRNAIINNERVVSECLIDLNNKLDKKKK